MVVALAQSRFASVLAFVAVGGGDVAVFLFAALPIFCAPPQRPPLWLSIVALPAHRCAAVGHHPQRFCNDPSLTNMAAQPHATEQRV